MSAETNAALFAAIDAFDAARAEVKALNTKITEFTQMRDEATRKRMATSAALKALLRVDTSVVYNNQVYIQSIYVPGHIDGIAVRPVAALRLES